MNKLNFKQSIGAGAMAAGASIAVNAALFLAFHGAGIITDSIFIQPNQPLTIVPIIISSTLPTLVASMVFFLMEKYTKNGFKNFMILSAVLLALSFANPFLGIKGVTVGYALALNLMHVVIVAFLYVFIKRAIAKNN